MWLVKQLDSLAGAILATLGGMALSQADALAGQYLQRLGGHLDEARLMLDRLATGPAVDAAPAVRDVLMGESQMRVAELETAMTLLSQTTPLLRPLMLALHGDPAILQATLKTFEPAVPLTTGSLLHAGLGVVAGLAAWGLIKAPLRLLLRHRAGPAPQP